MEKVTKNEFEAKTKEGVVLVDFYADWCGPCQMLGPVLEELEQEENFTLLKVNVDEEPELAQQFKVMSIPMVYLFKDGDAKADMLGFHPKEEIREFIKKAL